jgi:hypothetical protein
VVKKFIQRKETIPCRDMKNRKQILDELNDEQRYPSYFRTHDFKQLVAIICLLMIFLLVVIVVAPSVWDAIDTGGKLVGVFLAAVGICCLGIYLLWIRNK